MSEPDWKSRQFGDKLKISHSATRTIQFAKITFGTVHIHVESSDLDAFWTLLDSIYAEGARQKALEIQTALNTPKPAVTYASATREHSIKLRDSE